MELGKEVLDGREGNGNPERSSKYKEPVQRDHEKKQNNKKKTPTLNCQGHLPELLKSEGTAGFVTHLLVVPAFLGAPAESADALWA